MFREAVAGGSRGATQLNPRCAIGTTPAAESGTGEARALDREELRRDAVQLGSECRNPDWDGEGADAVSPETIDVVLKLIDALPEDLEMPDISATPRGELDLDWARSASEMLTVSVGPPADVVFCRSLRREEMRRQLCLEWRIAGRVAALPAESADIGA